MAAARRASNRGERKVTAQSCFKASTIKGVVCKKKKRQEQDRDMRAKKEKGLGQLVEPSRKDTLSPIKKRPTI
ncbi:hypothetical protein GMJAKD_13990 [Candidatus Electrothrix aarhusensis]